MYHNFVKGSILKPIFFKIMIAIFAIFLVLWLFDDTDSVKDVDAHTSELSSVSVLYVKPNSQHSKIKATGIVNSRWPITLNANVRGQINDSFESIVPGSLVKKGQVIAKINDIEYAAMLEDAKSKQAAAKLELARVLNEQSVAKSIENGSTKNDYRLFKPHVAAAKASLEAAKFHVAAVLKQYRDTQIKAPFDAIVLAKHIAPSQQINAGDAVYSLASSSVLDVEVSLSNQQWKRLDLSEKSIVLVTDTFNKSYNASIRYLSPVLNAQTRQRGLTLTIEKVDQSTQSLLPEQQVDVSFSSKLIENAVSAPATVLTRDNKVWTITDNLLNLEQVQVFDESDESIVFSFVNNPALPRQLVQYPLSTMLVGQQAKAVLAKPEVK